ncbi:hypothetical protein [Nocardia sp. NPDC005745]
MDAQARVVAIAIANYPCPCHPIDTAAEFRAEFERQAHRAYGPIAQHVIDAETRLGLIATMFAIRTN